MKPNEDPDDIFDRLLEYFSGQGRLLEKQPDFLNRLIDVHGNRVGVKGRARIRYHVGAIGLLEIATVEPAPEKIRRVTWLTNIGFEGAYAPPKGEAGSTLTVITSVAQGIAVIDRLKSLT